jgi:hypothetical protein
MGACTAHLQCVRYNHVRSITAEALGLTVGWSAELEEVSPQFRCSRSQERNIEITCEANVPNCRRWVSG